jgi:Co/Zn/Cd efflux system component
MAAGVLIGLAANTAVGWWWVDPMVALVIAAIAVREGREAWEGEGCACIAIPRLETGSSPEDCCR